MARVKTLPGSGVPATPAAAPRPVTMEFHVSRAARERYGLDGPWFSLTGNVVLADFATSRRLAQRMNQARDAAHHPERAVQAGSLHAMGLIDEILHHVAALYRTRVTRSAMTRALAEAETRVGRDALGALLLRFTERFPPLAVHRAEVGAAEWLADSSAGVPHRELAIEELLLLWLANVNPAFHPWAELFDDEELEGTSYADAIASSRPRSRRCPCSGPTVWRWWR